MPSLDPTNPETISLFGPLALILIALVWGFARILYLNKTAGVSVLAVLGRKRSLVETAAGIVAIVLDVYLLARPFWPELDTMVALQQHPYMHWGVPLMAFGILIAIISQVDMGKSWRIGVPEALEEGQGLVTGGLYQFSRNPIYVGIMIFVFGALVVAPGPLTLASLVLTWLLVGSIIASEERFLETEFGEAYHSYKGRVRRWL
ncbi:MAG: isoprenylcysteine carboxylmethyltransferase family protein [Alphaproteobacteria bacterium]|nr:isoprenylcysteine carboxylmethyltransferase family protein [Alphaproteobacteria bacterium]